jgi:AraC family transcriptional regulator, transcriptional activator of pobA
VSELRERELQTRSIYDPGRLQFHVLKFVLKGKGYHWVDFQKVPVREGEVLYIAPSHVHAFDAHSSHDAILAIFLPVATSQQRDLHRLSLNPKKIITPSSKDFNSLLDILKIVSDLQSRDSDINLSKMVPGLLGALLAGISKISEKQYPHEVDEGLLDLASRLQDKIERCYSDRNSVNWYAKELGVSVRNLFRVCKLTRGQSPKQLLDNRVLLEAQRMLVFTPKSIDEIGSELGFSETTNFIKFFRRLIGSTPDSFRKNPLVPKG